MVFDNTKIKSIAKGWHATVPFVRGAAEIIAWHDEDESRRTVEPHMDKVFDDLIARVRR